MLKADSVPDRLLRLADDFAENCEHHDPYGGCPSDVDDDDNDD